MSEESSFREAGVRGVLWLGGGQFAAKVLHVASRLFLAQLLLPQAFGLVAMALLVTSVVEIVALHGFNAVLIQCQELTKEHCSTVFWAVSGAAFLLVAVGIAAAPLVGALFRNQELVDILRVMVVMVLPTVQQRIYEALLIKEMTFRVLSVARFGATLCAASVAVVLALSGAGVWALVAQQVLFSLVLFVVIVVVSPWCPVGVFSKKAFGEMWKGATTLSLSQLVEVLVQQLPSLLIGRVLGASALGYFSIARQIVVLPMEFIAVPRNRVMLPIFSRLQSQLGRMRSAYYRVVELSVLLAGALPGSLFGAAQVAVPVFLGAKWQSSVVALQIISIAALVRVTLSAAPGLLLGSGRVRPLLSWKLVTLCTEGAGLALGLQWGWEGGLIGWATGSILSLMFLATQVMSAFGISLGRQFLPLGKIVVPVFFQAVTVYLVLYACGTQVGGLALVLSLLLGLVVYALSSFCFLPSAWQSVREVGQLLLARRRQSLVG